MSSQIKIKGFIKHERGGVLGADAGPVTLIRAKNTSGGSLARGDVVIWDTTNTTADLYAVTTTTSGNNALVIGMCFEAIASNGIGYIQIAGPTTALKVNGTTDIAAGDALGTYTTVKIAQKTTGAGAFATALEAYATNDSAGVIDAIIGMSPTVASSGLTAHDHSDAANGGGIAAATYTGQNLVSGTGQFLFQDDCEVIIGTGSDITISWDGTDAHIAAVADDSVLNVGDGTTSFDLKLFGNAATDFAVWDASAGQLRLTDGQKVALGTGTDVTVNWDATDLHLAVAVDDSVINIGDGTLSADVKLFGNTTALFATWDASASSLRLEDDVTLALGTGTDVTIKWDGTDLKISPAADDVELWLGNGTQSFDVWLTGNTTDLCAWWDASASKLRFEDAVIVSLGDADDVTIKWDATDCHIDVAADDSVINIGNGTQSADVKIFGAAATDYVVFDASANNIDLTGGFDIRVTNIGTLDFPSQGIGTATFTVTGLTSDDIVIVSPREDTDGAIVVDKVAANTLTLRNVASEAANVEMNYYVLAKVS